MTAPTQLAFINLILGANPLNSVSDFERLSTLIALSCMIDNELIYFRPSVIAVASISICLNLSSKIPSKIQSHKNESEEKNQVLEFIEQRIYATMKS